MIDMELVRSFVGPSWLRIASFLVIFLFVGLILRGIVWRLGVES